LAAKLFVKIPNPPYNVTNVVCDDLDQQKEILQANSGHTFPMYSIAESIATHVRDSVHYLYEEEIMKLNLDGDGDGDGDGDNNHEKDYGMAKNDLLPFH
jgi:hypothetical protein